MTNNAILSERPGATPAQEVRFNRPDYTKRVAELLTGGHCASRMQLVAACADGRLDDLAWLLAEDRVNQALYELRRAYGWQIDVEPCYTVARGSLSDLPGGGQ